MVTTAFCHYCESRPPVTIRTTTCLLQAWALIHTLIHVTRTADEEHMALNSSIVEEQPGNRTFVHANAAQNLAFSW